MFPAVAAVARATLARTPDASASPSPRIRRRTLFSMSPGSSASTELSRSRMRKLTSAAGRAQFSEENA